MSVANGLGELTYLDDDLGQWAVRGDYRLRANTGNDLQRLVNGQWQNFMPAGGDYDPRTEGNVIDSNERRRFLQGFLSAPVGFDINSGGTQGIATAQGWREPDRSGGSGFGDFLTHFALPAAAMAFGIPALTGAGGAGLAGGAISSEAAALGMGGIDAAGWGSGALDVLGAGSGGGLSWLGNEGLATLPEAVGALPSAGASAGLEGLELGGEGVGQALGSAGDVTAEISRLQQAVANGQMTMEQAIAEMQGVNNAASGGTWGQFLTDQAAGLTQLPGGAPWYQQLLNAVNGGPSSIGKALGLGDTASGALGLLSKLLTAYGAAKATRESLSENDRRLREAKDTTPLSSTQFSMLRPTALRRAKGGLAQCAECGGAGGPSMARYVRGGTAGQSDKIPAMLSDGEYVFDADTVAALGDGNNEAGASALEQMRQNIRKHKRSAPPTKIPPKAKKPEQYMKGAK